MKLIDFEELMEMYNNKYQEFNVYDLRFLKEEYLPVVEAIPISWIDSYITDSELGITANNPVNIKMMLEDWDEENFQETARKERREKEKKDEIN